jgi:membrane protease YdiL (CAAX protease family)
VLFLALGVSLLPRGLPADRFGVRAWDGLGPWVDVQLPAQGLVQLEHIRVVDGQEERLVTQATLGGEVVSVIVYALTIPLALVYLRRRAPLRLRPNRRDLDLLLTALAWLVPTYALIGVIGAFVAASTDGGTPLVRLVYTFALPSLADGSTAWLPMLRMVVLAPLAEELAWRGIVFRGLRARWGFGRASLLTAFAFGLWHVLSGWDQLGALVSQYVFGLVACWLVERGGGLGSAILLHAIGNACALGLYALAMLAPERVLALFGLS